MAECRDSYTADDFRGMARDTARPSAERDSYLAQAARQQSAQPNAQHIPREVMEQMAKLGGAHNAVKRSPYFQLYLERQTEGNAKLHQLADRLDKHVSRLTGNFPDAQSAGAVPDRPDGITATLDFEEGVRDRALWRINNSLNIIDEYI